MRGALLIAGCAALAGCVWTEERLVHEPQPVEAPPAPEPPEVVMPPPAPPPPAPPPEEAAIEVPTPSIRLEEVVGTTPAEASVIFEDLVEPVQECAGPGGGALRIRLSSDGVKTFFSLDPGAGVDKEARSCVYEALSLKGVQLDETIEQSGSPSERAPQIQSLMTVSWPGLAPE